MTLRNIFSIFLWNDQSFNASLFSAVSFLKDAGVKRSKLLSIIGAPEGIARMQKDHPDVDIYVAAEDDHLNEIGYIVPGLGDAGDRIFGTK